MFTHRYRYLFVLVLAAYSYLNTLFSETFRYYGIRELPIVIFLVFVYICLLVWEGNRWIVSSGNSKMTHARGVQPLLTWFSLSLVVAAVAGISAYVLIRWLRPPEVVTEWPVAGKMILLFAFRINLFLQCLNAMVYLFQNYRQKEREAESLKQITAQAKLQAIRSQVNPHFLFNNLNVLSSLILQQSAEANTFVEKFSTVYRSILQHQDRDLISVRQELDFIKPYLYLLEKRFGTGLQVTMDIDPALMDRQLVPVVLQMLIENAIKHNIVTSKKPLHIQIRTLPGDLLEIRNNLQLRQDREPSTQVGLDNIRQRLMLIAQRDIDVHVTDQAFSVRIPLLYS